jgi:hypothetical protein
MFFLVSYVEGYRTVGEQDINLLRLNALNL